MSRIRFRVLDSYPDDGGKKYAVEVHRGRTATTVGRVMGGGNGGRGRWAALGIAAPYWTAWRRTRAEAVDEMLTARADLQAEALRLYHQGRAAAADGDVVQAAERYTAADAWHRAALTAGQTTTPNVVIAAYEDAGAAEPEEVER